MPVSSRVRQIEKEIDDGIRALPIWKRSKSAVLLEILQAYRDAIRTLFLFHFFFDVQAGTGLISADDVANLHMQENRLRSGTLWALKWATQFCPEVGLSADGISDEIATVRSLGSNYETFVDALKSANRDVIVIDIDESARLLICYEG